MSSKKSSSWISPLGSNKLDRLGWVMSPVHESCSNPDVSSAISSRMLRVSDWIVSDKSLIVSYVGGVSSVTGPVFSYNLSVASLVLFLRLLY